MSHASEPVSFRMPRLSWHVAADAARFYRDGVPVLSIPSEHFPRLVAEMAARVAEAK